MAASLLLLQKIGLIEPDGVEMSQDVVDPSSTKLGLKQPHANW